MEMMFSWLKYRSSFISRSVLRQNMEWSKGVIFFMATFWPEGLCSAELFLVSRCGAGRASFDVPDDTVCALSNDVLDVILLRDVERDFPGATAPSRCARHGGGCGGESCSWRGGVSMELLRRLQR